MVEGPDIDEPEPRARSAAQVTRRPQTAVVLLIHPRHPTVRDRHFPIAGDGYGGDC